MYRKYVLTDAAGWMGRLWNHPSVIMWVLSNESNVATNRNWETGPYQDFVLQLDPTRPTCGRESGGDEIQPGPALVRQPEHAEELDSVGIFPLWQQQCLAYPDVTCTNTEYSTTFLIRPRNGPAGG